MPTIIILCVRWYLTYKLSYRDLQEMMAERGVELAHTTILRWVQRYVPEFEKRWRRLCPPGRRLLARRRDLHQGQGPVDLPVSRGRQAGAHGRLPLERTPRHRGRQAVL